MKKIFFAIMFIALFFINSGCVKINLNNKNTEVIPEVEIDDENIEIVYDPLELRLLYYNIENATIKYYDNRENVFQYSFSTPSNYYTSGDSNDKMFKILKEEDGKIIEVYKSKNNSTAIFPLVHHKNRLFFILTNYNNNSPDESIICELVGNKLKKFKNTKNIISGRGAVLDNKIYYTVYNPEDNDFLIYSIDMDSYNAVPNKIIGGLEKDNLYAINNELYYKKDNNIIGIPSGNIFKAGFITEYSPKHNLLFNFDSSRNPFSLMNLSVINVENGKEVYINDRIKGYKINSNRLYIYDTDGTSEYKISDLKKGE